MRYFKLLTLLLLIIMPGVFSNPAAAAQTLKIGTLSPAGSSWMKKIQKGADEVTQKTEGRVKFKFYPGGVMGDDYTMLRKMRMGQLQGGAVMAGSLVESCPALRLYGLPMIFDSFKEVDYVRDRMDNTINEELEKAGYVSFGMADGGFAFVMSKSPVRTLDDVRNLKVWAPSNNQTAMDAIEGFGITPIPLSIADVRTSLQTGMIDTVTVSPIGAIALQWHTQIKYMTELPLVYLFGVFVVDKKAFDRIAPEDRKILREIMSRAFKEIDQANREDNVKAQETLAKRGIEFVKPDQKAEAVWKKQAEEIVRKMLAKKEVSPEMYKALQDNLAQVR